MNEITKKRYDAIRLLGRYFGKVKREFRTESTSDLNRTMMVKTIQSPKNERGITIPTNRLQHYVNTSWIAQEIAKGLFPDDEDFIHGIGVIALFHDCGQDPFGHEGESALTKASKEFNGGPRLHNIDGAMDILFRRKSRIISAIGRGIRDEIIREESTTRNIPFEELSNREELGMEIELSKKIASEIEKNKDLMEEAVWTIATGAGNHNGERGTARIEPNFEITNEEFYNQALKTYYDGEEDKKMIPCSIVDAIVKISDQISSIPYDVIDAKRAGIEDEIYEGWAEPISKILNISIDEAKHKLKGTNRELVKMCYSIQQKLIESVIRCSTQEKIDMDLAPLMYGVIENGENRINGLRTFNASQHQAYTSTARAETILDNVAIELTEHLIKKIVGQEKRIPESLNRLFRMSAESPMRKQSEHNLMGRSEKLGEYREFYNYVIRLSAEEYNMHKQIVKRQEIEFYKPIVLETLRKQNGLRSNTIERSLRGRTAYLIEAYVMSPEFESVKGTDNGEISDDEILSIISRINDYLSIHPIDGIDKMNLEVERHIYELKDNKIFKNNTKIEHLNTDEQIAARIVISYLERLNDVQFLELAYKIGCLSKDDKDYLEISYKELKPKKDNNSGHMTTAMKDAKKKYDEGSGSIFDLDR